MAERNVAFLQISFVRQPFFPSPSFKIGENISSPKSQNHFFFVFFLTPRARRRIWNFDSPKRVATNLIKALKKKSQKGVKVLPSKNILIYRRH